MLEELPQVFPSRWSVYRRLGSFNGHELGPVNVADSVAVNLFTACVLGDPGNFTTMESAFTLLAQIAENGDSVRAFAPISPFIAPLMSGYELRLNSITDASAIRQDVQRRRVA